MTMYLVDVTLIKKLLKRNEQQDLILISYPVYDKNTK